MTITGTMLGISLLTLFLIGFPDLAIFFGEKIAETEISRWLVTDLLFWLGGLFIIFLSVFIRKYKWAHRIFGREKEPIYWRVAVFGVLLFVFAVVLAVMLLIGYS